MVPALCTERLHTHVIELYRNNLLITSCTIYIQSRLANLPVSEAGDMQN